MKRLPIILLFLLSACITGKGDLPTGTPPPTPHTIVVALTPAVGPIREALHICVVTHPELALIVEEIPETSQILQRVDLALRVGQPTELPSFAAPLAAEQIHIIVHPDNPIRSLHLEELRATFSGNIPTWEETGLPIQVWLPLEEDESRQIIGAAILGDIPFTSLARLAPSPTAMLEAVGAEPGAIGILPAAWLTNDVRAVRLPADLAAALRQPILALFSIEPAGAIRILVRCLQAEEGQTVIAQAYQPWDQ